MIMVPLRYYLHIFFSLSRVKLHVKDPLALDDLHYYPIKHSQHDNYFARTNNDEL